MTQPKYKIENEVFTIFQDDDNFDISSHIVKEILISSKGIVKYDLGKRYGSSTYYEEADLFTKDEALQAFKNFIGEN